MFLKLFPKFLIWLALISIGITSNANSNLVESQVITHISVNQSQLNLEQIRRIFSMRQSTWDDGQRIIVFVLANDHITHKAFTTQTLGLFPYQLERVWNKLVYSGLGEVPIQVKDEIEMIKRVKNLPGSIGYVKQDIDVSGVKRLNVMREQ